LLGFVFLFLSEHFD